MMVVPSSEKKMYQEMMVCQVLRRQCIREKRGPEKAGLLTPLLPKKKQSQGSLFLDEALQ